MEPKFQTTFIPKKQTTPTISGGLSGRVPARPANRTSSVFMIFAVLVFLLSVGAVGGAYLWKNYLNSNNQKYKAELASKEQALNIPLIEKLKKINIQVDAAKNILNNHVALSNIFSVIPKLTVDSVRFLGMEVKNPGNGANISLSMKGQGRNLPTVAFQSDILGQLSEYGLSNVVRSAALTNPSLTSGGVVTFDFSAEVDPKIVSYKASLTNTDQ